MLRIGLGRQKGSNELGGDGAVGSEIALGFSLIRKEERFKCHPGSPKSIRQ
jgi:hypothetical protein